MARLNNRDSGYTKLKKNRKAGRTTTRASFIRTSASSSSDSSTSPPPNLDHDSHLKIEPTLICHTMTPSSTDMPSPSVGILKRADEAPAYGDAIVTIQVGAEENSTSFLIHENLARSESTFIDASLRGDWKEKVNRIVNLPEHDPDHFAIFFNFIYARAIFSTTSKDNEASATENDKEWMRLANAYALGSYLGATDFKDAVTDAIVQKITQKSGGSSHQTMYKAIYPSSSPDSGVRRLLVEIAIHHWSTDFLKAQPNQVEWSDFFVDVAVAAHQAQGIPKDKKAPFENEFGTCAYHEHGVACVGGKQSICYENKVGRI